MRIISLYQPYATLMVMGLKTNETRGWDTKYRGTLGIHATASMPAWCKQLMLQEPFYSQLKGVHLPLGRIVGTVEVVGTLKTEDWIDQAVDAVDEAFRRNEQEMAFGDYSPGRFAWQTINPLQFDNPVAAKGHQGFWNYDLQDPELGLMNEGPECDERGMPITTFCG